MSELANLQICTSKFIFCTTTCRHAVHPLKDHRQAETLQQIPSASVLHNAEMVPMRCVSNPFMRQLLESHGRCKGINHKEKKEVLDYLCLSFRLLNDKHPCLQVFIHYDHQNQYVLKNSKTNQI